MARINPFHSSDNLKKRQAGTVPDLLTQLLGDGGAVPQLLNQLLGSAGGAAAKEKRQEDGAVVELLSGLLGDGGAVPQLLNQLLGSSSGAAVKRDPQLLTDLAPPVTALLSGLGLPNVGVPVGGVLTAA